MAKQENETLYVIAAAYDDVDLAVVDDEAVTLKYRQGRTSHEFDAPVMATDQKGEVPDMEQARQQTPVMSPAGRSPEAPATMSGTGG